MVVSAANRGKHRSTPMSAKTMRAISKLRPGPGLDLTEVPVPVPGPNDVLIKIRKTSICGTDVHIYNWDEWAQKTIKAPMVIGHEFVGTIEEVGRHVQRFQKGDLVDGEGHIVCGVCRNCLAGRRHLCKDTKGVGVNRNGRLRRVPVHPGHERRAGRPRDPAGRPLLLRPPWQRHAHGAPVGPGRRGRAHHRRRPHRLHGRGDRAGSAARARSWSPT